MTVTNNAARITGVLRVVDKEKFQSSFYQGLSRGRAFGFGLLQIVPIKVS
jgi:CRISPR system Cascade subunit CasE